MQLLKPSRDKHFFLVSPLLKIVFSYKCYGAEKALDWPPVFCPFGLQLRVIYEDTCSACFGETSRLESGQGPSGEQLCTPFQGRTRYRLEGPSEGPLLLLVHGMTYPLELVEYAGAGPHRGGLSGPAL